MITFATMYNSSRWRGPMIIAYGMFEKWPSACEWMVPNSDKAPSALDQLDTIRTIIGEKK